MNAYEQKQEERRQRYLDLASNNHQLAESTYKKAHDMASVIPFGQPILVGHHSERSDRNYRDRIHNTYGKSFEADSKAQYYEQKAASVGKAGISSDNPDAVELLKDKLAGLEELQTKMKAANKALKKDDIEALHKLGFTEDQITNLKTPDFCGRIGFPDYRITNNGATIRATKKRIAELEAVAEKSEPVEVEYDGFTYSEEDNRCQFIFPGKPSEEIRTILKSHSFKWSPTREAWVRQLTGNGKFAAKCVIKELKEVISNGQD